MDLKIVLLYFGKGSKAVVDITSIINTTSKSESTSLFIPSSLLSFYVMSKWESCYHHEKWFCFLFCLFSLGSIEYPNNNDDYTTQPFILPLDGMTHVLYTDITKRRKRKKETATQTICSSLLGPRIGDEDFTADIRLQQERWDVGVRKEREHQGRKKK